MSHIPIKNAEEENGTVIYFPVPNDNAITLDDLRGAFPGATSLRYKNENDDRQLHILCRDNVFVEPEGGWHVPGRLYFAVVNQVQNSSRFGLFESYRRQLTSRTAHKISKPDDRKEKKQSDSTMICVGHGHFVNGIFRKISTLSLSGCGGLVQVGPVKKYGNTSEEIRNAAFDKFAAQNRTFKQKFKSSDQFYLVYPDGSIVERIPGSSEEFSLEEYRMSIDPQKRFDRLRLYICTKSNYDLNQIDSVEITSDASSSSEELPVIEINRHASSAQISHASNSTNELPDLDINTPRTSTHVSHISSSSNELPAIEINSSTPAPQANSELVVEVIFHDQEKIISEHFSNNAKILTLKNYIKDMWGINDFEISYQERILQTVETLMKIGVDQIHVEVQRGRSENTDLPIRAGFFVEEDSRVASEIATVSIQNTTSEPVAVLKHYQLNFLQGRPLDIHNEAVAIDGDTTAIFISRSAAFVDSINELENAENIRFPLEVNFHGENAEDDGGPRKEFFGIILDHIRSTLLETKGLCMITLKKDEAALALKYYYYAGVLIGLSAIEGGPIATFLDEALRNSSESEEKEQFVRGLQRTGIMQLLDGKRTFKYLFRPSSSSTLTVNKFLHVFQVQFSDEGSNDRMREESIYREFVKYTREVYAGRRGDMISLEKILQFVTCTKEIPALGFTMQPTITFLKEGIFPTSTTCINRLVLPATIAFDNLDLAFVNAYFGRT